MNAVPNARPVYLIDASIFVFRAWYSMPGEFADPRGRPTNAVYGYARFLCEFLERVDSAHVAVAFDESLASSFRNEIYPDYKANREPPPEALERQFGWCRDLTGCLGLPAYGHTRYEADDLIAALSRYWRRRGHPVHVISGDKDLAQLVVEAGDRWWDFGRGDGLDRDAIKRRFGVRPGQIADFLALTGDAVDNIPGVAGVGPKTAAALLAHFDSLDGLYARLDELAFLRIRGAKTLVGRLRHAEPTVRMARRLTGLDMPLAEIEQRDHAARGRLDGDRLDALLDQLGFGVTLRRRLHASAGA